MAPASWGKKYSYAQLEQLWINAGGPKAIAPVMAAIAIAESGGYEKRISPPNTDGTVDRGLWQINSVHGKLSTTEATSNAASAVKIYKTQGLKAWTTYTNGAYKKELQGNVPPDANLPSGSTSTATQAGLTGDIGGAIGQGLGSAFQALLQPLISTFIWGSEVMFGIGLMVGGIIVMVLNTDAAKSTGNAVVGAAAASAPEATFPLKMLENSANARRNAIEAERAAARNKKARQARVTARAARGETQKETYKPNTPIKSA